MDSASEKTIAEWIVENQAGTPGAREQLIRCAFERLTRLASKMLRGYPRVRRWEETSDVRQAALIRLDRAIKQSPPATERDFFRLSACAIRRELIDLTRRYQGPLGLDRHHARDVDGGAGRPGSSLRPEDAADLTHEPQGLALWTEFHERIQALPADQREVFDLLWYQGLTEAEAARILGISKRTVERRWLAARLRIYDEFNGRIGTS